MCLDPNLVPELVNGLCQREIKGKGKVRIICIYGQRIICVHLIIFHAWLGFQSFIMLPLNLLTSPAGV